MTEPRKAALLLHLVQRGGVGRWGDGRMDRQLRETRGTDRVRHRTSRHTSLSTSRYGELPHGQRGRDFREAPSVRSGMEGVGCGRGWGWTFTKVELRCAVGIDGEPEFGKVVVLLLPLLLLLTSVHTLGMFISCSSITARYGQYVDSTPLAISRRIA